MMNPIKSAWRTIVGIYHTIAFACIFIVACQAYGTVNAAIGQAKSVQKQAEQVSSLINFLPIPKP